MRLWLAVGVAAAAAFVVAGASGGSGTNTIMMFVNTRADPGNSVRAASGERDFLPEFLTDPQADKSLNSMTDAVALPALSAPADQLVGGGDGFVDLVVSLSAPGSSTVSVHYATFSSSAVPSTACNGDYTHIVGDLTFAPGETTKVLRVQILDCPIVEPLESFTLDLSTATNATIARASVRVMIIDNSTVVATPRLFVRDATVDEKDGKALVAVLLGGPDGEASNSTVTVDYTTTNGTASAGADYTTVSGTLSFAAGETVKTIAVPITDDAASEPPESFTLNLSNPSNATIADTSGTVLIGANDATAVATPALSAPAGQLVGEGDGFVDLVVSLSAPGSSTVSVHYATFSSSAVPSTACNGDYTHIAGDLTFAPGETTKVLRVQILDCPIVEPLESFTLDLSTATNATIARASVRVMIIDNSTVVATPRLFVRDATVDEKDGKALVAVLLGGPDGEASNSTVTVDYTTTNGTASAGADYTTASGTLSFAAGETVKTIAVPITDDAASEPPESFTLNLSNPSNATIADTSGTVLIGANDATAVATPALSAPADQLVGEGDGFVDLVVSLSAPGSSTVSVHYATFNSSAVPSTACNGDYTHIAGDLTFAPGETTKVLRVQILDCPIVEPLESFTLDLSTATNATIARASVRVMIIDDGGTLTSIAVTPANPSIAAGANQQFSATGTFSDAETADLTTFVTWAT